MHHRKKKKNPKTTTNYLINISSNHWMIDPTQVSGEYSRRSSPWDCMCLFPLLFSGCTCCFSLASILLSVSTPDTEGHWHSFWTEMYKYMCCTTTYRLTLFTVHEKLRESKSVSAPWPASALPQTNNYPWVEWSQPPHPPTTTSLISGGSGRDAARRG